MLKPILLEFLDLLQVKTNIWIMEMRNLLYIKHREIESIEVKYGMIQAIRKEGIEQ